MSGEPASLSGRTFPVILSAPSGGGKTTVARLLRERRPDVTFSISATTREPLRHERDGRDYWFTSPGEFRRMAASGELVEWAEVHGNLYGTPRRNLEEAVARGEYLLLDIDIQGARQIREKVPDAVQIFILPPSGAALVDRLLHRGSEDDAVRRRRIANARQEIAAAAEFDYVVVNDRLEATVAAVEGILEAESRRSTRMAGLAGEIARLDGEIGRWLEGGENAS